LDISLAVLRGCEIKIPKRANAKDTRVIILGRLIASKEANGEIIIGVVPTTRAIKNLGNSEVRGFIE
jgi:hypothetical protein